MTEEEATEESEDGAAGPDTASDAADRPGSVAANGPVSVRARVSARPRPAIVVAAVARLEPTGQERAGDRQGRDIAPRRRRRDLRRRAGPGPELPQLVDDGVEAQAGDELHDVVRRAILLADAEDRHDVGVVQPGRRPGLALEADELLGVADHGARQDLQGHVAAQ